MRFRLDPANLCENGKAAASGTNTTTFVPFVTGGSGEGYWNAGNMARYVFTTNATTGRIRLYCNEATTVSTLPVTNTLIPFRVNGENRSAGIASAGDNWYPLHFGTAPGVNPKSKRIEIFVPILNATVFGQAPTGAWPIEVEFDGDATIVAPLTTGQHWVMIGDSILASGMFSRTCLDSAMGLAKLGAGDSSHRTYAGVYNPATLYTAATSTEPFGQIVQYTDGGGLIFTWEKISAAAAGTTPVIGADWRRRGFVGRVTTIGWGTRRWWDDIQSTTTINALVAQLVALGPTRIGAMRGVNDKAQSSVTVSQHQTQLTAFLNALGASALSAIPIVCYGTTYTPTYEPANGLGSTLDDWRAATAAAVAATTHAHASYVNLKSTLVAGDLVDQLHPGTAGHRKLYEAM
ncbi:hypothetical protein BH10PSE14_BH10PSE14_06890 [soil metagenome]